MDNNILNSSKDKKIIDINKLYPLINTFILSNKNFLTIISDIINNVKYSLKDLSTNVNVNKTDSKSKTQRINSKQNIKSKKETIQAMENKNDDNIFKDELNMHNNEYINNFILLKNKIYNLKENIKKSEVNINMELYIQELINYCDKNDYLRNKLNIEKIKEALSFTDNNKNRRILNKLNQNKSNYFYYLLNCSSKIIDNIKLIVDFLNKYHNIKEHPKMINESEEQLSLNKTINSNLFLKKDNKDININLNSSISNEYEKDESSIDTQITQNVKRIKKNKIESAEKKTSNKLYDSFINKTCYIRNLHKDMNDINSDTLQISKSIFEISKKKNEEEIISNQMLIYNNPNLKVNELSSTLYNDLNSLIINTKRMNKIIKKDKKKKNQKSNSDIIMQKLFKKYN